MRSPQLENVDRRQSTLVVMRFFTNDFAITMSVAQRIEEEVTTTKVVCLNTLG